MKNIRNLLYMAACAVLCCLQMGVFAKNTSTSNLEKVELVEAKKVKDEIAIAVEVVAKADYEIKKAKKELEDKKISLVDAAKIIGENKFKRNKVQQELAARTQEAIEKVEAEEQSYLDRLTAGVRGVGQGAMGLARSGWIYSEEEKAIALSIIAELEEQLKNPENLDEQEKQELQDALNEQRAIAGIAMSASMENFWVTVAVAGYVGGALLARQYFSGDQPAKTFTSTVENPNPENQSLILQPPKPDNGQNTLTIKQQQPVKKVVTEPLQLGQGLPSGQPQQLTSSVDSGQKDNNLNLLPPKPIEPPKPTEPPKIEPQQNPIALTNSSVSGKSQEDLQNASKKDEGSSLRDLSDRINENLKESRSKSLPTGYEDLPLNFGQGPNEIEISEGTPGLWDRVKSGVGQTYGWIKGAGSSSNKETTTIEPEIKTIEPEIKTVEPEIKTVEPEIKTVEPEIKTVEPEIKTVEPEIKTVEPEIKTVEPEIKTVEPEIKTVEPEIKTVEQPKKTFVGTQAQRSAAIKEKSNLEKYFATASEKKLAANSTKLTNDLEKLKIDWANLSEKNRNPGSALATKIKNKTSQLETAQKDLDAYRIKQQRLEELNGYNL